MPQPALLAHDLVRTLGGRRVLDGVCLTASPGHRIGLIGENGVIGEVTTGACQQIYSGPARPLLMT
ncbi:hypothetical protein [Streptomyces sp. NPDC001635]|nr:hypothetical protein E4K10_49875 [Streptomyces sp. T1317-0309]TFV34042.1 hypothetical protein E4K10_43795 [Streptomyces sp. T1317-0309]